MPERLLIREKLTSVDLADGVHADGSADVYVTGHRSASGIVPILVVRSQFLGDVGLHDVNPFGQLDLAGPERENGTF